MERSEVREIDIRYKASGLADTIASLNRLVAAEEGVVVVTEKVERSDKSLERSLGAIQGRYVENHRLIQQVTRDMSLLHEAKARGIVDANAYAAALAGMEARLKAVAASQGVVIERTRGWAALSAASTGTYGPMMAQVKAAEDRLTALQRAEAKLRSINVTAATQSGQPGRAPPDPNRRREYATNQALMQGFDILPQIAAGVNPATILIQQGPQVAQSWAMAGMSMKEGLKDVGSRVMGVITPVRVLTAGVATLGVTAVMAYADWLDQQKQLEASLAGVGRGAGVTARGLNDIAMANAAAGEVSNATARQIAGTYVATGKIGTETLADLIKATRDYAATTGQEIPDAAAELAKAFSDPARGAEVLNGKLGILDASLKRHIDRLAATGDAKGAQETLYAAMVTGLEQAGTRLTWFGRLWESTKQSISNGWTGLFEAAPLVEEIAKLEASIARLERARSSGFGGMQRRQTQVIEAMRAELEVLRGQQGEALERANEAARRSRSLDAQNIVGASGFDGASRQRMEAERARIQKSIDEGGLLGRDRTLGAEHVARLTAAINSYIPAAEKARRLRELDIALINARTPAERAEIAAMRARIEASGDVAKALEAENEARGASARIMAEARREAEDYAASQTESRFQSRLQQQAELAGVGQTAEAQDQLRKEIELTAEARRRAFQLTGDFNNADLTGIRQQAAEWAKLQAQIREAGRAREAGQAAVLLGMDPDEASIRSRFELDAKGEIISANDRIIAQQLRQNEAVREMQQAFRGVGEELLGAWRKGGTGFDVLLGRVQSAVDQRLGRVIDNGINSVIDQMMGGLVPGLSGIANPATSVATMQVTATSVIIGGAGVSSLLGGAGGAATQNGVPSLLSTLGIPANASVPAGVPSVASAGGYEAMLRASALKYGVNPDVAVRVANSEGGLKTWQQSHIVTNGLREPSYGPMQMLVGGPGTGFPGGMGNDALARGIDPRNPAHAPQYFDYAMQRASQGGWSPWYGAAKVGVGRWDGINRGAAPRGPVANDNASFGGIPKYEPLPQPTVDVTGVNASLKSLEASTNTAANTAMPAFTQATQQAATTAIPALTQNATTAAPALGQVGQQAGGLVGAFQSILSGVGQIGGGFLKMLGFEDGGYTGSGGRGAVAGVVHGQEFVAHAEATRRWRPMLEAMNAGRDPRVRVPVPVMAPGGGGNVSVSVINNGPGQARVEERDDGRGGRSIEVVIDEVQAKNSQRPGSASTQAFQQRYGARPKTRRLG